MRPSLSVVFACVASVLALAPGAYANKGGTLDPSFGVGGLATASGTVATALAIQPDGRIVAVGGTTVARFDTNGALDPTFGTGGEVTAPVFASAVVVQPDGRIVVTGGSVGQVTFVRYEANGTLDATFGTGGVVNTAPVTSAQVTGVALQSDGRIIVVGKDSDAFMVRRYDTDGSVDGAFGTGGVTITPIGPTSAGAVAVVIEPGDAILVAGSAKNASGDDDFALARYGSGGTLDGTFGNGGIVTTAVGSSTDLAQAVARDASGRILVAGSVDQPIPGGGFFPRATLVRYDALGVLDSSFGTGGVAVDGLAYGLAGGVAVQADGKIVVGGTEAVAYPGNILLAVARLVRFTDGGVLDTPFGYGGGASTSWHDYSSINGIALTSDGRIIAAGYRADASQNYPFPAINFKFTVVRAFANSCGDANLEIGEGCDDGNVANGDCCSSTCDFNAAGTLCDDGQSDLCTAPDACDGAGTCVGHVPVTCGPCETCNLVDGCVVTARPSCKMQMKPAAGRLNLRSTLDNKNKLQWQWSSGAATTVGDFGSPDTTDDLAICVFDSGSQLVGSAPVPAGGTCDGKPCWRASTHGFRFRRRDGLPGGITGAQLVEGVDTKAKIKIDGKGSHLALPSTASLSLPLKVQLQTEHGECWESSFSASGVTRQDSEWFKARSD